MGMLITGVLLITGELVVTGSFGYHMALYHMISFPLFGLRARIVRASDQVMWSYLAYTRYSSGVWKIFLSRVLIIFFVPV